jgi:large subunit ribosomal protein L30
MELKKDNEGKEAFEPQDESKDQIAIIRIRGLIKVHRDVKKTLDQLRLYKKNCCIVIPNDKTYQGMIAKVKDYTTWGEIDDSTYDLVIDKKGEEYKGRITDGKQKIKYNHFLDIKGKKMKKFFRLNSPKKGYGRKGIKVPFNSGGALGYRGKKINELIKRMI